MKMKIKSKSTMIWTKIIALIVLNNCLVNGAFNDNYSKQPSCAITIVEDQNNKQNSLFVYTTDNNYALLGPSLKLKNWQSFVVNDQEVSIISFSNKTLTTKFAPLNEETKKEVSKIRNNFIRNLAGLSFSSCSQTTAPSYSSRSLARQFGNINNAYPIYPSNNNYNALPGGAYGTAPVLGNLNTAYYYPSIVYNNLLLTSELNETLDGDVYQLCAKKPELDIYSSSVSVRVNQDMLMFYRSLQFFAYRGSKMPLNINTLLLNENLVVFVYNDKTIAVKLSFQLNNEELEIVLEARVLIKGFQKSQDNAVEVHNDDSLPINSLNEEVKDDLTNIL